MHIRRRNPCSLWLPACALGAALTLLLLALPAGGPAAAQESGEEEAAVVVGEDEAVVSETSDAQASAWNARAISLRPVGDKPAYVRQSSEAFEDADARLGLELKYYFELPPTKIDSTAAIEGPLAKGRKLEPGEQLLAGPEITSQPWAGALPLALDSMSLRPGFDVEFVDYEAGAKAKVIAAILPPGKSAGDKSTLIVARTSSAAGGLQIDKTNAVREFPTAELPQHCVPGGLLDTWDRPKTLGSRALFVGRVIAVLKLVDGRYAVDFYGEALHPDSDCRVWLWRDGDSLGKPVGIQFTEVAVKKGPDAVGNAWVLAVAIDGAGDALRTIAFDYPLCKPAVMAQLQAAAPKPGAGGKAAPPPDLEKMVGSDLLDEFSRRLVNGTYK